MPSTDSNMEEINVTQAARHLSELLKRDAYQGTSFELTRGGRRIARLLPSGPPNDVRVSDLNALFDRLPRLDPDDIDAFETDVDAFGRLPGLDVVPFPRDA